MEEGEVYASSVEGVEVWDIEAPLLVPPHDGVIERAVPGGNREFRVRRQLYVAQALSNTHVIGVAHPVHSLAHRAQVLNIRVNEGARVERCILPLAESGRNDELRVRLYHVVHLNERLDGKLPV